VPLLLAATISAGVAWVAWRAGTLTGSGLVAGWTVGTSVLYGCGWSGGAVLAAFFVSSNLISRLGPAPSLTFDAKSDRRDLWQVYANGGAAALGALAGRLDPSLGLWLLTASLAAAAADTWATSIGTRAGMTARLLLLGPPVAPGTNGGMSGPGTVAALLGAALVSGTAAWVEQRSILWVVGTLVGFAGMAADSILGATLQGRYRCPACEQPSEWRRHRCGALTEHTAGVTWINNDAVNFLATSLALVGALLLWRWLD
jgi:uncharacterized protein (TIGR00297 family)